MPLYALRRNSLDDWLHCSSELTLPKAAFFRVYNSAALFKSFLLMNRELKNMLILSFFCFFFLDDGISIPCEYTSFLAPISAPKLHYEVSQSNDSGKGPLVVYSLFLLLTLVCSPAIQNFGS